MDHTELLINLKKYLRKSLGANAISEVLSNKGFKDDVKKLLAKYIPKGSGRILKDSP